MSVVSLRKASSLAAPVHFQGVVAELLPDGRITVDDEQSAVWVCRRAASCHGRCRAAARVCAARPRRRYSAVRER